ncbi:hypothetical protein EYZ11_000490 [Aspergillus tanneri]|uniref:Uncharacterized protein n=1 Tax=Aspergillus tanneri TaxID=1220188 RepID=A0A4S3JX61_9EURO|nr:uncharacterized protein ATNIH1004_001085 [Aspergillus tanneri]KAA8652181.1 hypothetical protein ATNIH1004_001085 [Aspergillus tanneri]THD00038.1 hypothetical protein EYZ11_000490 [Aspergillus tanneri]
MLEYLTDMDESVAEGIYTALQTCPPDPEASLALGDLPTSPSISYLHVNDLGLTPPPGSQMQQSTDAIRISSPDENHDPSARAPARPDCPGRQDGLNQSKGLDTDIQTKKHLQQEGYFLETTDTTGSSRTSPFVERLPTTNDKKLSTDGRDSSTEQGLNVEPDDSSNDVTKAFFYDPLFDSDSVLREIDVAFKSQKRTSSEAFPEGFYFSGSAKKQHAEATQEQCTTPNETPSLSSADSVVRLGQGDSAPHTPAETDRAKSLDPFFTSLDTLFEDSTFGIPLEMPADSFPFDLGAVSPVAEPTNEDNLSMNQAGSPGHCEQAPEPVVNEGDLSPSQPSLSEMTKRRFSLDSQDIIANTSREVFRRVYQEPEYTSPYPAYGGRLGYLPSAPGVHVRYIEVAENRMNYRLSSLRDRVQQLTRERNKYRNEWVQWATVDPATGKTKEQLLREENVTLRRVSSHHQNRVEQYKQEIEQWKNRLSELGTVYNNLLYEIHVQRKMPAVSPIPPGYKPQSFVQGPAGTTWSTPVPPPLTPLASSTPAHDQAVGSSSRSMPAQDSPAADAQAAHENRQPRTTTPLTTRSTPMVTQSEPVTIDLTVDTTETPPVPTEASSEQTQQQMEMLQSLRNKKYNWLNDTGSNVHWRPQLQDGAAPMARRDHDHPHRTSVDENDGDFSDDDLARAMEAELERSQD